MAAWLDRWAQGEQRRADAENGRSRRVQRQSLTGRQLIGLVVCAGLATLLPWQLWLTFMAISLTLGPGRRWWKKRRLQAAPSSVGEGPHT
jgi:hypothetical protein